MAKLEQRHFKLIAQTLKDSKPAPHWDANKMAQWESMVREFMVVCKSVNPKFKRDLFTRACDYADV